MVKIEEFSGCKKYTIQTPCLSVSVMELGAAVTSLCYAGREMVIGHRSTESYRRGTGYVGAVVGRYANRIARGHVCIDGQEYRLTCNEGRNHLHGGKNAFDQQLWQGEVLDETSVRFTLHSPHGDNGYPGSVTARVTYSITGSTLRLVFQGESDAQTLFAPTSHMYFTLGSEESCLETQLQISAESYLPVDDELLPLGAPEPSEGSFDFHRLRPIAQDYDHAFLLTGSPACRALAGDVLLEIRTDFPALQLYTGSGLAAPFTPHQAFALEPEYCPDSPHHPEWGLPLLCPGEVFEKYAEYVFHTVAP